MIYVVLALVVVAVVFFAGVGMYNGLVRLRHQVERAWANIDVILKQRYDEIPQLIQIVEQFAQYESGVIAKLVKARENYGSAHSINDKIKASQELSLALKGIVAIGEAYPELKSNNNFMQLQTRVSQLEESIADRREVYNETIANFNARIEQFPDVFVARFLGYQRQDLFKVSDQERTRPSLNMNLPRVG